MGWMSGKGVKVKKSTDAESSGGGFKDGDRVNCRLERIALDSTDNEFVVKQHGEDGAANFVNIMLRSLGKKDGSSKNAVIFHKLFTASENAVRASGDCQYLATYATIKDEEDNGYYADLIESDQEPDDSILKDMIGMEVGITVGVMNDGGRDSVFVRKLSMPFDFDNEEDAAPKTDRGSRGRRGRGGESDGGGESGGRSRGRGRAR